MTSPPPGSNPRPPSWPPSGGEPLIPILAVEEALHDPVALATWHEALSDAMRADMPHDLLALWLYPADGGVALLGPAALADDRLSVPLPAPMLVPAELEVLEAVVRRAGYGSVIALPIRAGRRDVGLILAADLRPDGLGRAAPTVLHIATQRLAPTLSRLARWWKPALDTRNHPEPLPTEPLATGRWLGLIDALGEANTEVDTPRAFTAALRRALGAAVPHDHLELLVGVPGGGRWLRLGEHSGRHLWADPAFIIERDVLDVDALFAEKSGQRGTFVLADTYADARWPRGFLTTADPPGAELRSVVGARVAMAKGYTAYLILGSVGPEFYREDDALLLSRIAGLAQPRIESFVRGAPEAAPRRDRLAGRHPLAAAAERLATLADPAEALRLAADEAKLLLPIRAIQYVVRLMDDDRVVIVEPGEQRLLPDLPLVPLTGAMFADVLLGAAPYVSEALEDETRLAVPLRVGGEIHGAVVLTASRRDAFDAAAVTAAQRFADLVAPHIELRRRAALVAPPYRPGWKRSER